MTADDARYAVGVGAGRAADATEVHELVRAALADAGIASDQVDAVATVEDRLDHPALRGLPWPRVGYRAEELAAVDVPHPSDRVAAAIGTPSVAEAAALLAAGPGAAVVVPKRGSDHATVAVARSAGLPPGGTP